MNFKQKTRAEKLLAVFRKVFIFLFWGAFILLCFIFKDEITVDAIVSFIPKNAAWSVIIMLLLYAIKSVAVFVYGGILYAASGILFSLPLAIVVNTIGTVIMTSIPFYIGKKAGKKALNTILEKNQKLELIRDLQNQNEFFISFIIRMVGLLPADLVAMYLGASGMRYKPYFWGTVIGLFPSIICFTVMGMKIDDVGSLEFIISACVEIGLTILSVLLYFIWRKTNKKKQKTTNEVS